MQPNYMYERAGRGIYCRSKVEYNIRLLVPSFKRRVGDEWKRTRRENESEHADEMVNARCPRAQVTRAWWNTSSRGGQYRGDSASGLSPSFVIVSAPFLRLSVVSRVTLADPRESREECDSTPDEKKLLRQLPDKRRRRVWRIFFYVLLRLVMTNNMLLIFLKLNNIIHRQTDRKRLLLFFFLLLFAYSRFSARWKTSQCPKRSMGRIISRSRQRIALNVSNKCMHD